MEIGFLDFMTYEKDLIENHYIKSYGFLPGVKTPKKLIEYFEQIIGQKLSPFFLKYLCEPYPLSKLQWNDDYLQRGSAYFPSLKGMITGSPFLEKNKPNREKHKGLLWSGHEKDELIKNLETNYFIFDFISDSASAFTLIKFEKGEEKLFLYTYPNFLFPLKLSVEGYLKETSNRVASHFWQELFIDAKNCDSEARQEMKSWRGFESKEPFSIIDISKDYDFIKEGINSGYRKKLELKIQDLTEKIGKEKGYLVCKHPFLTSNDKTLNILSIRKVEYCLNRKLPNDFLAFYSQINGLELEWKYEGYKIGGRYPAANARLLSFEEVFGGFDYQEQRDWHDSIHEGLITDNKDMDNEMLFFARQCRPILISEGITVVARFLPNVLDLEILLLINGKFYPVDVSFVQFVEVFLQVAGIDHFMVLNKWNKSMSLEEIAYYQPVAKQVSKLFGKELSNEFYNLKSNME